MTNHIECSHCHEIYEYEDDGETYNCMPNGVFPYGGLDWLCDECMTCPKCDCPCFDDECNCERTCKTHGITSQGRVNVSRS